MVGDTAKDQRGDTCVERRVIRWEGVGQPVDDLDRHRGVRRRLHSFPAQIVLGLDGEDLVHAFWIVSEVKSMSGADFDHPAAQPGEQLLAMTGLPGLLLFGRDPLEDPGEDRMMDLFAHSGDSRSLSLQASRIVVRGVCEDSHGHSVRTSTVSGYSHAMEERERLRRRRDEAERKNAAETRQRLVAGYFVAGLLSLAIVAAIVVVVVSGGGGDSSDSGGGFGTHFEGLQQRRAQAGVPTMAEGGGSHFHPHIEVFANGEKVTVPVNIGIDPGLPLTMMAGLHTHDTSGTIHNEAGDRATLSQFFVVWGVPISESRLGPYKAEGQKTVRMWVDRKQSRAFGKLRLADGQQIVISYGDKGATPPPLG